jgi:hypothetical protein
MDWRPECGGENPIPQRRETIATARRTMPPARHSVNVSDRNSDLQYRLICIIHHSAMADALAAF